MRLSGSPIDAMFSRAMLVVGCEDDPDEDGAVRLYVGARYRNQFLVVAAPDAAEARRAWASTFMGHLWAIPDADEAVHVFEAVAP